MDTRACATAGGSDLKPPSFFVVGFPRSGTTIFATLLSRHSRIAVPPETQFCHGVLPSGRPDFGLHEHRTISDRVFGYWRTGDLDVDRGTFDALFEKERPTYANALSVLLECFRRDTGKSLVGEKSPVHLLYAETLLRWYPDAQIFIIVRDGRDVVESMVSAPFTHDNRLRHAAEWSYRSKLAADIASQSPDKIMVVKFEELVQDTGSVLARVCDRLGLAVEGGQLRETGKSTAVPEWEREWKGQALRDIDPGNISRWKLRREVPLSSAIAERIMTDELDRHGYEPGPLGNPMRNIIVSLLVPAYTGIPYRVARRLSAEAKILLHRLGLRRHL